MKNIKNSVCMIVTNFSLKLLYNKIFILIIIISSNISSSYDLEITIYEMETFGLRQFTYSVFFIY